MDNHSDVCKNISMHCYCTDVLTVSMRKSTEWPTWTVPCLLNVIALGRFVNLHEVIQLVDLVATPDKML